MTVIQLPSTGTPPTPTGRRPAREVKREFHQTLENARRFNWDHKRNCFDRAEEFTEYVHPPTQHEAKAMCAGCPMLDLCKEFALTVKPGWTVLGGISWHYGRQFVDTAAAA